MKLCLYCADCVRGVPLKVAQCSVDVVVTSPPYNIGTAYRTYEDSLGFGKYLAWTLKWTRVVRNALRDDGSLFLNLGAPPSRALLPHAIICAIVEHGFALQNTLHWIKSIAIPASDGIGDLIQRGHYKPVNSQRFLHDCHEFVFHLTKRGDITLDRLALGVPYADKSNIARWNHTAGRDRHCRGNAWFVPYKTIQSRATDRPHPATFPPELAANCIKLHGKPEPIVMDPFLGLGNSAIAAAQCGAREFIGFEIDSEYLAVATKRAGEALTQDANRAPK